MDITEYLLSERYIDCGTDNSKPPQIQKVIDELGVILRAHGSFARIPYASCPLCQNPKAIVIARKDQMGLPVDKLICSSCGLVFSSEHFSKDFAEIYFNKYAASDRGLRSGVSPDDMFRRRINPKAYSWKRYHYIKENIKENYHQIEQIVEVGCGDGCNLYPFFKEGKKTIGCDYSEKRINAGRNHGLTIYNGSIEVLISKGIKADLIILSQVIAYITDPNKFLNNLKKILSPEGFIYVETPGILFWNCIKSEKRNIEGFEGDNDFLGYLKVEENFCFELETLQLLLNKHGFQMISGDQIIRSIFRYNNKKPVEPDISSKDRAQTIYNYLKDVEKDYNVNNTPLKRWLRKSFHFAKNLIKKSAD